MFRRMVTLNKSQVLDILLVFLIISLLIVSFIFGLNLRGTIELDLNKLEMKRYEYYAPISCESDSMGLTLDCKDTAYGEVVRANDEIIRGDIYVYESGNSSVIHRLVNCVNNDCSGTLVFKGDANRVAEFVNRTKLRYHIIRIDYK